MKVLVANIGSTSFKYRLFDMDGPDRPGAGARGADRTTRRRLPELRSRDFPVPYRYHRSHPGCSGLQGGDRRCDQRSADRHRRSAAGHGRILILCSGAQSAVHRGHARVSEDRTRSAFGGAIRNGILRSGRRGGRHLRCSRSVEAGVRDPPLRVPRSEPPRGQRACAGTDRARDLRHISCHLGRQREFGSHSQRGRDRLQLRNVAAIGTPAQQPDRRPRYIRCALHDEALRSDAGRDGARFRERIGVGGNQRNQRRRPRSGRRRGEGRRAMPAGDRRFRPRGAALHRRVSIWNWAGWTCSRSPAESAKTARHPRPGLPRIGTFRNRIELGQELDGAR
jgi:hypothetical protein